TAVTPDIAAGHAGRVERPNGGRRQPRPAPPVLRRLRVRLRTPHRVRPARRAGNRRPSPGPVPRRRQYHPGRHDPPHAPRTLADPAVLAAHPSRSDSELPTRPASGLRRLTARGMPGPRVTKGRSLTGSSARSLVVTADDFGIGPCTSRGILDLAAAGAVS